MHLNKVMAELTKGDTQTTLHQFYVMKYEDGVRAAGVRSKRMKKALKRIHAVPGVAADGSSDSDLSAAGRRGTKRTRKGSVQGQKVLTADDISDEALLSIDVGASGVAGGNPAVDLSQPAGCLSSESDRGSSTDEDLKIPKTKLRRRRKQARR